MKASIISHGSPLRAAAAACRAHLVWAGAFSALLNLLYLAPTLYMLQVYDRVVPSRGELTLLFLTVILALALATLSTLDTLRSRLFVRASIRLDRLVAAAVLNATLSRPNDGGEVHFRQAIRDFDTIRQILSGGALVALFDAPWIPIYLVVCFLLNPLLGGVVLIGGAIIIGVNWRNELATRSRLQSASEASAYAYISQEQSAGSSDVIRALGMRKAIVARQLAERETANRLQAEASFATGGYLAATRFVRLFLQSAALGVGAWLSINGRLSGGAIFAASFLVGRAMSPLEGLLASWRSLSLARIAWRNVEEVLKRGTSAPLTLLPTPSGAVEVERLLVMRPRGEGAILQGIGFRTPAGEAVAIIGPSGAGKSTLLRTLAGAGPGYTGAIRFDGAELGDYDQERLAAHIGYLPQEVALLAGTVKENIARFASGLDQDAHSIDEKAIWAAKASHAHEMILRLQDGYDTILGWGGKGLSAGQAQRIALARALYGAPKLLLLDEPNSHLDGDGEALLTTTIREQKARGVTVLIAAHRTSVLAVADRIIAMREGRIEMYGPRDEVLARLGPNRNQFIPASAPA